jgi:cyclopropane fatty-acyl-phospholipid synthase-like methyltransferase
MDAMTALRNFERLTGKPATVLDSEIQDYGVSVHELLSGKVQANQFLLGELSDIFTREFGLAIDPPEAGPEWDFLYRMMDESPAFRQYCWAAHENPMVQMNELDKETLERMFELLRLNKTSRVVDIGCGNGCLAEWISDRSGAQVTGIDISPYAIGSALTRTKIKRERLDFRVGDINRLQAALDGISVIDTFLALETLYASDDLDRTIGELKRQLSSDGQMLFIANQHIEQPETQSYRLQSEQTDIAVAIKSLDFSLRVFDLTLNKTRYLENSLHLLEQYKPAFEREGRRDFWAARIIYDRKMLKRVQGGLTRRFLYHAKKVEGK